MSTGSLRTSKHQDKLVNKNVFFFLSTRQGSSSKTIDSQPGGGADISHTKRNSDMVLLPSQ